MMKKINLLLGFLLLGTSIWAQEKATTQQLIDEQVWRPFIQAYSAQDADLFNSIHTDDVLRVSPWGIRTGEEYKTSTANAYAKGKASNKKRSIAFWFEHRQAKENIAYEVGYYKVTVTSAEGSKHHYARFHVVLRKEDEQWKIAQDWDTNKINGVPVTAADFEKGAANAIQ